MALRTIESTHVAVTAHIIDFKYLFLFVFYAFLVAGSALTNPPPHKNSAQ
ncbi:MAG: hypothetical protein ACO3F9_06410 [Burkholderiales bacterium]